MTEHKKTDRQLIDRFERFTFAIFTLHHSWNRIATEEMKRHGLKGAYAFYLVTIADADRDITAAQLTELCRRDKADVSRAIAVFQEKGILEKQNGNRYRMALRLTEKGRCLADEIRQQVADVLESAGQGLSEEMRENMYRSLSLIADNLKKI